MTALDRLAEIADDPLGYARSWAAEHDRGVVGVLPMNFPAELVHAAGALPFLIQESSAPITVGSGFFPQFYCGFTRSVVDQAVSGDFDVFDAVLFVDNCVQLIGAADVVRTKLPDTPTKYFQISSDMASSATRETTHTAFGRAKRELEELFDVEITDEALHDSIRTFNTNRELLRELHMQRREAGIPSARVMRDLVATSSFMDRAEHTRLVTDALAEFDARRAGTNGAARLHLSGHMCHAPKAELLELIEDCGAVVVNDDLYTGYRYISTDVSGEGDPMWALADWYLQRDLNVPCPTRLRSPSWPDYLLSEVRAADAQGVISLMAKFCEPQMYQQPDLDDALEREGIAHLLIETEHEGMPLESIRTRVEGLVEVINQRAQQPMAQAAAQE